MAEGCEINVQNIPWSWTSLIPNSDSRTHTSTRVIIVIIHFSQISQAVITRYPSDQIIPISEQWRGGVFHSFSLIPGLSWCNHRAIHRLSQIYRAVIVDLCMKLPSSYQEGPTLQDVSSPRLPDGQRWKDPPGFGWLTSLCLHQRTHFAGHIRSPSTQLEAQVQGEFSEELPNTEAEDDSCSHSWTCDGRHNAFQKHASRTLHPSLISAEDAGIVDWP